MPDAQDDLPPELKEHLTALAEEKPEPKHVNYIDVLSIRIGEKCGMPWGEQDANSRRLLRIYALLCLTRALNVTKKDVHDAWSAWRADTDPAHKSLVPFEDLSTEVQDLDEPYRMAIWEVAAEDSRKGSVHLQAFRKEVEEKLHAEGCYTALEFIEKHPGVHLWATMRGIESCAFCGVCRVKGPEGNKSPCRGIVGISLREG